jgi:hypothetical protein
LKRYLLILSDLIFDSRVEGGIWSFAAAPDDPATRPFVSAKVASIISFSPRRSFESNGCVEDVVSLEPGVNQLSSINRFSVSERMIDRSITFCNSLTLPGQVYDCNKSKVLASTRRIFFPSLLRSASRNNLPGKGHLRFVHAEAGFQLEKH